MKKGFQQIQRFEWLHSPSFQRVYASSYTWIKLLLLIFLLQSCEYPLPPQLTSNTSQTLPEDIKDSLTCLYRHHYTWNTNLEVMADSTQLKYLPLKNQYLTLYKGDKVVVAEFDIHPTDSIDSIWVKLAHTQEEQAWIRESEMKRDFAPTDTLSQAIHLFSKTYASYFIAIFAAFVGAYLWQVFRRKQLKMVYFNDIDSAYPLLLCLLIACCATVYESIQIFAPETWEHFYFNPTLSPFEVPFILSLFLTGLWCFLLVALAVLEVVFRQLTPGNALFYLLGLMSCCIFCYFFFILTTHIYIGYFFLAGFCYITFQRALPKEIYHYVCGNCGKKLKEKGVCPNCGAINR